MNNKREKDLTEKEIFERNFGVDVDKLSPEEKEALDLLANPSKSKLSFLGFIFILISIIGLLQLNFLKAIIALVIGITLCLLSFFIARHKAFKKFNEVTKNKNLNK